MSVRIMSQVWAVEALTMVERIILLALADWADGDGLAWPSMKQIAKKSRCSRTHAQRCIRHLEELGFVTVARGTGRGWRNGYAVHPKGHIDGALSAQERATSAKLKGHIQNTERATSDAYPLHNREPSYRTTNRTVIENDTQVEWLKRRYENGKAS